jgi:hypothetical protein
MALFIIDLGIRSPVNYSLTYIHAFRIFWLNCDKSCGAKLNSLHYLPRFNFPLIVTHSNETGRQESIQKLFLLKGPGDTPRPQFRIIA